jgi:hypothetical protein
MSFFGQSDAEQVLEVALHRLAQFGSVKIRLIDDVLPGNSQMVLLTGLSESSPCRTETAEQPVKAFALCPLTVFLSAFENT